jgi:hypothetical protein
MSPFRTKSGVATLSIPRLDGTIPCREAATIGNNFEADRCERIDVPRRTLDEYRLQNVSFIKIDVEGQEMNVLAGAAHTLERCRPTLLIEVLAILSRTDIRTELAAIENLGYRGSFLQHGQLHPICEFEPAKHQPDVGFDERDAEYVANFIFMPVS